MNIPLEWIPTGSAGALLGLAVWLILTGRIVPRSTYREVVKDRDQWREVALKAMGHTDQLLPGAEVATEVVRALGAATEPRQDAHSTAAWRALGGHERSP